MWKEYKETFDGVHASQRLKTEVLNMKREENAEKKRRIPAAALVAAVLVIAMAGTAMAEYMGWVRIESINSWLGPYGPEEGDGYTVTLTADRFPAENLSEEVYTIGAEIGDVHRAGRRIAFDSWGACEEFLGVELANNPRLEQMQKETCRIDGFGDIHAAVSLAYETLMPSYASVTAWYGEGRHVRANQWVQLRTQYAPDDDPEMWDSLILQNGDEPLTYETYITASGIEAIIFTDTYDTSISTFTNCYASFVKDNNMRFTLDVSVQTHENQESTGAPDAMELTKEILDAYE